MLFPLLVALILRVKPLGSLMIAAGFSILMVVSRTGFGLQSFLHATYDFGNFRAVPSFLTGMAIEVLIAAVQPQKMRWSFLYGHSAYWIGAHGFAVIILLSMLMHAPEAIIFVMFPVLVTLIALAERSGAPTFLAHPVFIRLGQCSFGIYLLHPFVALILRKCGWTNLPCLVLGATAGIVLSTLMAIASFRWFETPARKFLSRPYSRSMPRPHFSKTGQ